MNREGTAERELGLGFAHRAVGDRVARGVGWTFGIATQLLFLITVVYLFLFLRFGATAKTDWWWLIDFALAVGFAFPHSVLLAPPAQRWIKKIVPGGLLGCIHCVTTCVTLLVMFRFWGASDIVLWRASGWGETLVLAGFYGSWVALLYSLWLTGLGYQTGLTQWWYWAIQKKPPVRAFVTRGAYRWMRHPVYMSFLGLIWFTPVMTLDHAILTSVWTLYIYAGSVFKDRRLIRYIGEPYLEYASRVTGLPLIGVGSLRKIPRPTTPT
jgi:protein-S-isoprenylcysteine O-methyltransferase Ste14